MLENFIRNATHIYFACGATDFRKQTESLASFVSAQFKLDPYFDGLSIEQKKAHHEVKMSSQNSCY